MDEKIIESRKALEKRSKELDKLSSKIALARLAVFLVAIILFYLGFKGHSFVFVLVSILLFVGFILLVRYHGTLDEKALDMKTKSGVINRYLMRKSGEWKSFKDDGVEFLSSEDHLSLDLDLLGKGSLYQLISIAHTFGGRKKLAETLSLKKYRFDQISFRYDAIKELADRADFLIDFEALSERILEKKEKDEKRVNLFESEEESNAKEDKSDGNESKKNVKSFPAWMYVLMIFVPLFNIATILMVLFGGFSAGHILVSYIVGLVLTWGPIAIHQSITEPLREYGSGASDYYKILSLVADNTFESEYLKSIHDKTVSKDGLLDAIKSLGTINSCENIAFNPLMHMVLSGFFGWDFYISFAVSRWYKKNGEVFNECIDIVSEIEELGSLAVISLVRDTVKPTISKDIKININEAFHPLLSLDTVVANNADISDKLTIITGSNMSGKTTYMRTIAINMVLAYVGAGVCAKSFSVPKMKLFTSMRIRDDVSGGISTFYAEILRIKEMSEYILSAKSDEEAVPALCLIDEIFKGTNSADRIVGASEALKKLSGGDSLVIVTTHDFELCDLTTQDGTPASNYHFEEYYQNGELKFDYKLKNGKCTTRNAMALLEMAGLV